MSLCYDAPGFERVRCAAMAVMAELMKSPVTLPEISFTSAENSGRSVTISLTIDPALRTSEEFSRDVMMRMEAQRQGCNDDAA